MKLVEIITEAANPAQQAAIAIAKQETNEADTESCPPATQDIKLNLKNRQKAINEYGYGPLNPDMPNRKFWMIKVEEWNLDSPEEAKQSLCGNCAAFDQRQDTLDCIAQGIGSDEGSEDPTIDAGDLGYCRFLKFKCASRRTCDAWVTGGPLVDKQDMSEGSLNEFASDGFNGGDDGNDLHLYIDIAKKLDMKKYKPSTAHNLIAKKMAELVDVVDDDKVDYARHMARKAQGLPSMLDQQDVAEDIASTRREVNLKKKIDKGVATPEQKREYQELKAKNMGPYFLKNMGRSVPKQDVDEGETWAKHNNKRVGGMSKKSVASYRRSHPGSKIQTAVTTKPSKLKKGSKDAKRRKSFCARMRGMKKHRTGAKTARDPNSNINKSLRRWNCESVQELQELVLIAEQFIKNNK